MERNGKRIHAQNGQGLCLLDIEIVWEVIHAPTTIVPFINNLSMTTVQTSKMMEPVSIVLLWGTTHHVSPRKYTTFSNDKKATAYPCGQHNYAAKEISKHSSDIVRNAITRDCSSTPGAIQSTSIIADLRSRKNWQEVEKNAKKVGNVK